jgi:hypothetical protein
MLGVHLDGTSADVEALGMMNLSTRLLRTLIVRGPMLIICNTGAALMGECAWPIGQRGVVGSGVLQTA